MQKVITASPAVAEYDKVIQSYLRGYKNATDATSKDWWGNYYAQRTNQIATNHGISKDELLDAWSKWLDEVDAN